ncbi:MAG: BON domain-containing protein [Chloroflexi bacterium]|nr:BON domain-containing protein [Chloroflexota bacterium]
MDKTTLISEMQKFHFGSKIFCSDGEDGVLTHVAFDPAARCLTHIGAKQGRFFGKTVYLAFSTVVEATGEGVTLNITRSDLAAASQTAPAGALLDNKSVVQLADSTAKGTVTIIAVQPASGELAYLVAHELRPGQDTLLRQEFVTKLDPGRITVSVSETTLQTFPPYRPDDELQQEVEDILFDLTPLHVDFRGMTVRVLDSVLYLDGNISSSLRGDIVQDQALGVQGLLEIKNRLVGDDRLAGDLALALSRDPRTRDLPIGVYPRLGVVRLSGAVHNAEQKAAAQEIAQNFPGVRSVINDLVINPKTDMLRVMASAESGGAEDKVPGKYIRHTK